MLERLISIVGFAGYVRVTGPPRVAAEPEGSSKRTTDEARENVVDEALKLRPPRRGLLTRLETMPSTQLLKSRPHRRGLQTLRDPAVNRAPRHLLIRAIATRWSIPCQAGPFRPTCWRQIMYFRSKASHPCQRARASPRPARSLSSAGSDVTSSVRLLSSKAFGKGWSCETQGPRRTLKELLAPVLSRDRPC